MINSFKIIIQVVGLYVIYYIGTFLQHLLSLPIPGSIIGIILLFCLLKFKVINEKWLSKGAHFLITYLSLLFIPAAVGIIDYLDLFKGKGSLIIVIVISSTLMVMVISASIAQFLTNQNQSKTEQKNRGIEA